MIGLIAKFFRQRLSFGFYALIPNGDFTSLRAPYVDEREQYFSNSLHPELYADRLKAISLAAGAGGRAQRQAVDRRRSDHRAPRGRGSSGSTSPTQGRTPGSTPHPGLQGERVDLAPLRLLVSSDGAAEVDGDDPHAAEGAARRDVHGSCSRPASRRRRGSRSARLRAVAVRHRCGLRRGQVVEGDAHRRGKRRVRALVELHRPA